MKKVKILSPLLAIILSLMLGCNTEQGQKEREGVAFENIESKAFPEVAVIGGVKKVIKEGEIEGRVALDTLNRENLYALGPVAKLQGEISILNGEAHITDLTEDDEVIYHRHFDFQAAFLVYAHVKEWQKIPIEGEINQSNLPAIVAEHAAAIGIDTAEMAFPFLLSGPLDTARYHIIKKRGDFSQHNKAMHYDSKVKMEHQSPAVEILGFYSQNHEGIFTHHGSYVHAHLVDEPNKASGHLETFSSKSGMALYLPKAKRGSTNM